jgi:hypothetical protein
MFLFLFLSFFPIVAIKWGLFDNDQSQLATLGSQQDANSLFLFFLVFFPIVAIKWTVFDNEEMIWTRANWQHWAVNKRSLACSYFLTFFPIVAIIWTVFDNEKMIWTRANWHH